jgi:hypothetical protein
MKRGETDAIAMTVAVCALVRSHGLAPLLEYRLPNGMRLDVAAVGHTGYLLGIEIKTEMRDFNRDLKWPVYMQYCKLFFIAVPSSFDVSRIPDGPGVMIIDQGVARFHHRNRWRRSRQDRGLLYNRPR